MCIVDGCDRKVLARGLCTAHWRRDKQGKPLNTPLKPTNGTCLLYAQSLIGTTDQGCIIWPFAKTGFPVVVHNGKRKLVTRFLCEEIYGAPVGKQEAAHSCGKGHLMCVNPNHLRWATHIENEADKVLHGTLRRGETSRQAKLKESEVISIRDRVSSGERVGEIASEYGVSHSAISMIVSKKRWAHI